VAVLDLLLFTVELSLDDGDVSLELLVEPTQSRVLQGDELVNVNQVVAEGHLVLLLRLVEVAVDHLKDGILGVDLSVVILLVDLHLLLELLGLGDPHDLTPVGEDLHAVEMCHLLLLVHGVLEVVPPHLHLLLLLVQVLDALVLVPDLDEGTLLIRRRRRLALHKLS